MSVIEFYLASKHFVLLHLAVSKSMLTIHFSPPLQVDFGSLRKVTRVATQGASSFFVTRFQLKFSNNSIEWLDYTENGIVKVKLKISRRSDSFSQRRYRKIKRPFKFKREPNYRIHF